MYSTVLIIGAGESGICAAVQLKQQLNFHDFVIYDRHGGLGGTWWANTYPGIACDVPAVFYSFSFAKNNGWTRPYPQGPELYQYFSNVCEKYGIKKHITCNTEVEKATWNDERKVWVVELRQREKAEWEVKVADKGGENSSEYRTVKLERKVGETWTHECKVLISAVGGLVEPKKADFKGIEEFKGSIFHSGEWDHSVDYGDKNVVVVGNGCSALQVIPAILPKVKSLTQFIRSQHWILPRTGVPGYKRNGDEDSYARSSLTYLPGVLTALRALVFFNMEYGWGMFRLDANGEKQRKRVERLSTNYIRKNAPEKYWDLLIPKFPVGCKRRIFDDDYVPALNSDKIVLTDDPISYLTAHSVHTVSGKEYKTDVIVMSTGYKTNEGIGNLEIIGKNGESLNDHWAKIGGPAAYNTTAVNGFPNFFIIFGPNSATGHSSVILASEMGVKYSLHFIAPIIREEVSEVEVKREAELSYSNWIQTAVKQTVWRPENCKSWYVTDSGWNSSTYPASQYHYAWRSYFPTYTDWIIKRTKYGALKQKLRRIYVYLFIFGLSALGIILRRNGLSLAEASALLAGRVGAAVGLARDTVAGYVGR